MKNARIDKVLETMAKNNLEQMIISDINAVFYLSGKWFEALGERLMVLILREDKKHTLVINRMFPVKEDLGIDIVYYDDVDDSVEIMSRYLDSNKCIGVDKIWPAHFLLRLIKICGHSNFVNGSDIIDYVRQYKDDEEKDLMRKASLDNDAAMGQLVKIVNPDLNEKEIGRKLYDMYIALGNSAFAFDPIVAFGDHCSDPHHQNTDRIVKDGDSVILDIGGIRDSYASDMTRTFFYKSVSDEARDVYETVRIAQQKAIDTVKPGVRLCDVDKAARDYITEKGYGEYFLHRTGHFIGIECHEKGDVSSVNTNICEPGMTFSIEPGIYIPNGVGVRIEDIVLVTENGCEVLNKYSKELTIID